MKLECRAMLFVDIASSRLLLSIEHKEGKHKARFAAALGLNR
jgi:hypothetical protein